MTPSLYLVQDAGAHKNGARCIGMDRPTATRAVRCPSSSECLQPAARQASRPPLCCYESDQFQSVDEHEGTSPQRLTHRDVRRLGVYGAGTPYCSRIMRPSEMATSRIARTEDPAVVVGVETAYDILPNADEVPRCCHGISMYLQGLSLIRYARPPRPRTVESRK
jgi:hypothetical protein